MRVMIRDIETENNEWYGELASPRCPDNYVVMDGYRLVDMLPDGVTQYPRQEERFTSREDWLAKKALHLDGVDMLVAHNAPYEMSWWLMHYRDEFLAFLKRGGRVFCTAYAHYLLSHQQDRYPSLDEIAPVYGGTQKVDGVKILWEQGFLTSQIDPELLSEYLSGPEGDVENTTKVFLGQWAKLSEQGMLMMALVRMEGMLFFSECMHNGLKIDMEVAMSNLEKSSARAAELRAEITAMLPADMPEEARAQFKLSSDYHVSSFLFGGVMKYEGRINRTDAEGNVIYEKVLAPYFESLKAGTNDGLMFDANSGLYYHVPTKTHQAVYKAGKNKGQPKFVEVPGTVPQTKKGDLVYTLPGLCPLDSLPKDIRAVAKDEWVGKRTLCDGTPVYSSSGDVLKVLAALDINGPKQMHELAALDKDIGTYYLKDEGGKVSGMLQYVQPSGLVHHKLNVTSTVTGRLSSSTPNLQQLPRGDTSDVKQMFVSRFPGGSIIECDYSALEVVGLASFTKDKALTEALLKGTDMHCMRLSKQLGEPYEEVLLKCKDESHPEHKRYKSMRTEIKAPSFLYQYGGSAYAMVRTLGCTLEYAENFINNEKELFPDVEKFYEQVVFPMVEETGAKNMHREQTDDGVWRIYKRGYWRSPGGTCYSFRQHLRKVNGQNVMQYKPTEMRNYGIQGETAFWVQAVAGLLIRWLLSKNFFDGKCLPINQCHDSFYLDCAADCPHEAYVGIKAIMQCIPEYINFMWPEYKIHVPFPAEAEYGPSMYDKNHVEYSDGEVEEYKQKFLTVLGIPYASV